MIQCILHVRKAIRNFVNQTQVKNTSTNKPSQNNHQNDVKVNLLAATWRSDFMEKHRYQTYLEGET
jgi:hypothetical protein